MAFRTTFIGRSVIALLLIILFERGAARAGDQPSDVLRQQIVSKLTAYDLNISGPSLQAFEVFILLGGGDADGFLTNARKEDLNALLGTVQETVERWYSSESGIKELDGLHARQISIYNNKEMSSSYFQRLIVTYFAVGTTAELKNSILLYFRRMVNRHRLADTTFWASMEIQMIAYISMGEDLLFNSATEDRKFHSKSKWNSQAGEYSVYEPPAHPSRDELIQGMIRVHQLVSVRKGGLALDRWMEQVLEERIRSVGESCVSHLRTP